MTTAKRQPLTAQSIYTTAIHLVDVQGLEALSMRKLGQALGVEAMSLYKHIANKDALLDGMVSTLLQELTVPTTGDWQERCRTLARAYRQLAHAHPQVFRLMMSRPHKLIDISIPVEACLAILREAGFAPRPALLAFSLLTSFVEGYARTEIMGFALQPPEAATLGALPITSLPTEDFPYLTELLPILTMPQQLTDQSFEFGLDVLLLGLQQKLILP